MKTMLRLFAAALLLASATSAFAATLYVDGYGINATPPYTNWATAARSIQDAVYAASAGDEIVVADGVYDTGCRVNQSGKSRVVVDKPLTVRSVNGPNFTTISGDDYWDWVPGVGWVEYFVRCVYLAGGASLSGFTLANGYAAYDPDGGMPNGGGVFGDGGTLTNCVLTGNTTRAYTSSSPYQPPFGDLDAYGGGAYGCTLNNCTLSGNSATRDGYYVYAYGGGAYGCTLNNCALTGNEAAPYGGGAFDSILRNCALTYNTAIKGGGVYYGTLNNCALTGNSAYESGGGAYHGTLNNCTLTGNWAYEFGGGAIGCALSNCVVYFNTVEQGADNVTDGTLNYCCTTPLPTNGVGNISSDPQLASAFRLSALSPCIGKGNSAAVSGTDIDGEPWANPPSMGCDEYHAGAVTGPLTVFISPSYINVTVGYPVSFTAFIEGRTDLSIWDFGDGALEINEPYTAHSWTAPGDYLVSLWAFSDSYPGGTNATVTIHVGTGLHYVAANSATSSPPFLSWATAATNIQDAINAATEVGTVVVLVTNGTYARITAYSPLTVRSVNGAQFTTIDGGRSNRCASLSSDASLSGFTLTNGASGYGAGASGGTLSNCVLSGNSAYNGGGAGGCTLINCSLTGNTANTNTASVNYGFGGGASDCTLQNCTLAGNAALEGGGAYHGTLTNCMLGGNLAYDGGGGANYCALNNCTLTQNSALRGGGAIGGTLNNCTLTGNSVTSEGGGAMVSTLNNCTLNGNSATNGGGAVGGTLNNCTLTGNSATNSGGGAYGCTLNNCTLIGNSASNSGGGVYYCTLNNCITYFNTAPVRANYTDNFLMNYCCTTPLPPFGGGNISNVPLFVDTNGWADLRLQSNSPCINAGNNSYLTNSYFTNYFDLDGSPRIKGGNVDMGAYEYQSPVSRISYAWLQQYGLPINASTDTADPDGDGLNNWQEWVSGTDPTNALSALRMMAPVRAATAPSGVTLTWQSVAGVNYFLERSTNLAAPVFVPLATNLFGQPGTTSYTDYSAIGPGPWFYRVGVSGQ